MAEIRRITPCLWFDHEAEEAAAYYVDIFPNSRIRRSMRYDEASAAASGQPVGSVLTVTFELDGQAFIALNGGPLFKFNESVSFMVNCADQSEVDYYWDRLTQGGDEAAQQCGWLKDRFGVSWQVVPIEMESLLMHPDPETASKVMEAMLQMKKLDLPALKRAAGLA